MERCEVCGCDARGYYVRESNGFGTLHCAACLIARVDALKIADVVFSEALGDAYVEAKSDVALASVLP